MHQDIDEAAALLSEQNLAGRWHKSRRTLQRWRAAGYGPAFVVLGGSVRYRLEDVLAFEMRQRRGPEGEA